MALHHTPTWPVPTTRRRPTPMLVSVASWPFAEGLAVTDEPSLDFVALDDALEALAKFDERKSRVIELRFFGGLSVEETASVLKVSPATVMGDWRFAKAWLQREMRAGA